MKTRPIPLKNIFKLIVVALCLTGFVYQTVQFLFFYFTYPTVVDIQEYIVSETDVPGVSFCNSNALDPVEFCRMKAFCFPNYVLRFIKICQKFPEFCIDDTTPPDLTIVTFHSFLQEHDLNLTVLEKLKRKPESFVTCKIVRGSKETECEMDDILVGSYYSDTLLWNSCYTIYSLWGNPKKKIQKIGKYDKIILDFFVDMSSRGRASSPDTLQEPLFALPTSNPSIQLSVHSPYVTGSPFTNGLTLEGGRHYKVKLKVEDNHLLPSPYQTNCTDYMTNWTERGGIGPLNQIMAVEECKLNKTLNSSGCVPFSVDYPHMESICRHCTSCTELSNIADECSTLLALYNQPCDFVTYKMQLEETNVLVEKVIKNNETGENETLVIFQKGFDCSFKNRWRQRCHDIRAEIVFDDFLVTNLTYKPKIENLELFSVIGGYMGMYLGVSFVTTYDIGQWIFMKLYGLIKKKRPGLKRKRIRKNKVFVARGNSSTFRNRNSNFGFHGSRW